MTKPCVTEERFEDAVANYEGWCSECQAFTRGETEPDAEEYDCPECGQNTVTGAENALLKGLLAIEEDSEV